MNRRSFLRTLGIGGAALAVGGLAGVLTPEKKYVAAIDWAGKQPTLKVFDKAWIADFTRGST